MQVTFYAFRIVRNGLKMQNYNTLKSEIFSNIQIDLLSSLTFNY